MRCLKFTAPALFGIFALEFRLRRVTAFHPHHTGTFLNLFHFSEICQNNARRLLFDTAPFRFGGENASLLETAE